MFRRHYLKELSAYLDNQLKPGRNERIQEHLKGCKLCSLELEKLRLLSKKLKTWQAPETDAGFDNAVREQIVAFELQKGETKMEKKTLRILVPSSALVVTILAIFVVGHVYTQRGLTGKFIDALDEDVTVEAGKDYAYQSKKNRLKQNYRRGVTIQSFAGAAPRGAGGTNNYISDASFERPAVTAGRKYSRKEKVAGYIGESRQADKEQLDYMGDHKLNGQQYQDGSVVIIQPVLPATSEGQKVIRTADISLEVQDGKEAYKKINSVCQELGGYLASSEFFKDTQGRESGRIVMRVPKEKFLSALEKLADLGKVENSSTYSRDVAQEYANLKARLDAAMVVYNKTLEALQKRQTSIPDAMRLESELTPVLQRVEDLKNQIEYLNNAISFTTVSLYFHEPKVSAKLLKESRNLIKENMLTALITGIKFLGNALPVMMVLVIFGALSLAVTFVLKALIRRFFKKE